MYFLTKRNALFFLENVSTVGTLRHFFVNRLIFIKNNEIYKMKNITKLTYEENSSLHIKMQFLKKSYMIISSLSFRTLKVISEQKLCQKKLLSFFESKWLPFPQFWDSRRLRDDIYWQRFNRNSSGKRCYWWCNNENKFEYKQFSGKSFQYLLLGFSPIKGYLNIKIFFTNEIQKWSSKRQNQLKVKL